MSCPHSTSPASTPDTCSMCIGAVARAITRDPNGRLLIDGNPHDGHLDDCADDECKGCRLIVGPASNYGRTVPKKKRGRQSPAVAALRLVEPESVDDLDD